MLKTWNDFVKDLSEALNNEILSELYIIVIWTFGVTLSPCRHEVRSTFNLWSTLLAETRRMARDRATLAEVLAAEMGARLDIMTKDVAFISRKV